ncbi:uncharacterized protein C8Q71DRAFT_261929 [Rhodofomes roseus]|uniref:Uncharacterized protein n=1 Tax=Rhodofomes roseus TaxID=34475 RepID=A0ABQ8K6A4_9APHY|nr:uncharacterized protein C8Q71DRAFT_261929 [Rhodofomes roseus]KAH9832630.1 hypothetical protein C8Q71DRAFT_261929 [Rhodofomes roseus]
MMPTLRMQRTCRSASGCAATGCDATWTVEVSGQDQASRGWRNHVRILAQASALMNVDFVRITSGIPPSKWSGFVRIGIRPLPQLIGVLTAIAVVAALAQTCRLPFWSCGQALSGLKAVCAIDVSHPRRHASCAHPPILPVYQHLRLMRGKAIRDPVERGTLRCIAHVN